LTSIFVWTCAFSYPGKFDNTPELTRIVDALEKVCIDFVEVGSMTKDLALLAGPEQGWISKQQFLAKIDENFKATMQEWLCRPAFNP
jgi:isocitrate dehydrogenase